MNLPRAFTSGKGLLVKRALGASLMIFSALGLLVSLVGLVVVCKFGKQVAPSAHQALNVAVAALDSTKQNLDLVQRALGEAEDALGATQSFIEGVDNALQNTGSLIGSLSDTLADDLPAVILESQHALSAAEEGAAVMEDVLYGLNAISALTGLTYDPDVSLTESFARINESLDAIPDTLAEVDESLNAVSENLDDVQTSLADLTGALNESQAVLAEAQASVRDYTETVQDLTVRLGNLQGALPGWIRTATFSLYFLLIWLAVSQIGLLWQGWEMVSYQSGVVEERLRELEEKIEKLARQPRA